MPSQLFRITRPPEIAPLSQESLHEALARFRMDAEWSVAEVVLTPAKVERKDVVEALANSFPYNLAHEVGTCAKCGREMRYNVPRLGPDGGYVHKDTGKLDCQTMPNDGGQRLPASGGISEPPCSAMSCGDGSGQFPGPVIGGRGKCIHCGEEVTSVAYHEANACKRRPNAAAQGRPTKEDVP